MKEDRIARDALTSSNVHAPWRSEAQVLRRSLSVNGKQGLVKTCHLAHRGRLEAECHTSVWDYLPIIGLAPMSHET